MHESSFDADQRQRAVAWAVAQVTGAHCGRLQHLPTAVPPAGEAGPLDVYRVLYHSRAAGHPSAADLRGLLAQSRAWNAAHGITGLLLYSEGRYVQLLEGPEAFVRALYARIEGDARHERVVMVGAGPAPRQFADWSMAFGHVALPALERALSALEADWPFRVPVVSDPRLAALLDAFL